MTQEDGSTTAVRVTLSACPICGARVEPRYRPFCSASCADRDLARWLTGSYRIPTNEPPPPEE